MATGPGATWEERTVHGLAIQHLAGLEAHTRDAMERKTKPRCMAEEALMQAYLRALQWKRGKKDEAKVEGNGRSRRAKRRNRERQNKTNNPRKWKPNQKTSTETSAQQQKNNNRMNPAKKRKKNKNKGKDGGGDKDTPAEGCT